MEKMESDPIYTFIWGGKMESDPIFCKFLWAQGVLRASATGLRLAVLLCCAMFAVPTQAQITDRGAAQASSSAGSSGITVTAGSYNGSNNGINTRNGCGGGNNTISPPTPGGAVGEFLLALVVSGDSTTLTPSVGWNTLLADNPQGSLTSRIYWRIASGTGNDNLTVTKTGSGCNVMTGQLARFSGVDPVTPFDHAQPIPGGNCTAGGTRVYCSYQNANTVSSGEVSTTTANAMTVFAALISDNRNTDASGFGYTELFDSGTGQGNDVQVALSYRQETTASVKGPLNNVPKSGGNDHSHGVLFALKPDPAAGGITVNVPAGTVANDVMIASIAVRPCSNTNGGACTITISPPAGWTLVRQIDQTGGGGTGGYGNLLAVYRRVATGAEPANYTWGFAGTPLHAGVVGSIASFAGVDTTSPIVVENGQATGYSYTHATPDVSTGAVTNTMLVSTHAANSGATWTPPAGMTEVVDGSSEVPTNALGISMEVNYELRAAAGATGTRTATHSNPPSNDTGATHILALRPAVTFTHYAITAPAGTNFARCEPAVVRITAHNASHVAVNPSVGTPLVIRTSTNTGVWQAFSAGAGDVGTAANFSTSGANDGQASYTWSGTESVLQVRLRHNTIASPNINLNPAGTPKEDATEDPVFNFADAVWRVTANGSTTATVGTQISGKESNTGFGAQTLFLQAVATAPATGACTTQFRNQTVNVGMGAVCNNPGTCSGAGGTEAAIRNSGGTFTNIAKNNGAPGTYTNVSLAFSNDTNAMAPFVVRYGDAGQITIHMSSALPSPPAGTTVIGSSNAFVVRPFGLRVSGVTTSATPGPAQPVFTKAGQNFNTAVTAVVWKTGDDADTDGIPDNDAQIAGNAATPSFGQETSAASAALTHTLNAPLPGTAGTLGGATNYTGFASGTKTQAVNWDEVGFINLFAQTTNYLSSGQNVRNSTAGLTGVGRFYPDHLLVTPGTVTNRQPSACAPASTFTYQGEPLRMAFMLTARNALATPATTTNYTTANGYARFVGTVPANFGFGAVDLADATPPLIATALTARLALGTSSGTWLGGIGNFTADLTVNRAATPDGPFESFRLGVLPVDADLVSLRNADLNLDTDVPANGNDRVTVGSSSMRFGRLRLGNVSGSQLLKLQVPVEAQYWNGTFFITNAADSCTALATTNIGLGNYIRTGAGTTSVDVVTSPLSAGRGSIRLNIPASDVRSVDVAVNLGATGTADACPDAPSAFTPTATAANKTYLRSLWCTPPGGYAKDPAARVRFGISGSGDERIYMRENY